MDTLRRLSIAVLALAVVTALATQMALSARAAEGAGISMLATAAATSDHLVPPCRKASPVCVDHIGCVTALAVPASPTALGVPIEWRRVRYSLVMPHFAGQSVEPELSPPILAF